jgi:hypothetical protein
MPFPKPKIVVAKPLEEEALEAHPAMEKFEQKVWIFKLTLKPMRNNIVTSNL